jgi:hypothetical protein
MRPTPDAQPPAFIRHTETRQMNRCRLPRCCFFEDAGYDASLPVCRRPDHPNRAPQ